MFKADNSECYKTCLDIIEKMSNEAVELREEFRNISRALKKQSLPGSNSVSNTVGIIMIIFIYSDFS